MSASYCVYRDRESTEHQPYEQANERTNERGSECDTDSRWNTNENHINGRRNYVVNILISVISMLE